MLEIFKPRITVEESVSGAEATFTVEPLERGYGITIGNSLRRVLCTALPGAAVRGIRIEGVKHEFSTVPGVREDVADIILNLKELAIKVSDPDNFQDATVNLVKSVPGVVSAPVVYRDNSYYLTHDFYGRESAAGALFLDVNHPLAENTQNLLIYGHNMHDGTMFGHFRRYQRTAYWQENCFVRLSTLYTQEIYVIFAVMTVSTNPASPQYVNFAGHPTFRTVREFDAYMEEVQAHTLYPWKVDVNASDALLTLATCLDEERVVLLARRLREGESVEDVAAIMAA